MKKDKKKNRWME